jgi:hypothetical protein
VQKLLPDPPAVGRQHPRELFWMSLPWRVHDETSSLLEAEAHLGPGPGPLDLGAQKPRPADDSVELSRLGGHARDAPHEDAFVADADDDGGAGVGKVGARGVDDAARYLDQEVLVPTQTSRLGPPPGGHGSPGYPKRETSSSPARRTVAASANGMLKIIMSSPASMAAPT